jgi:hypothetical protein
VVVAYRNDQLVLEDGNHRVETLRRAGRRAAWAIVNFADADTPDGIRGAGGYDVAEPARMASI